MAIGWADIQDWDPADLNTTSENLSTARSTLMTEAQEASGAKSRVQSTGTAVNAMLTTLGSLNKDLDTLVNDVSELMMATSEASNGVWDVQTKVQECTSFTEQYPYLTISTDGTVDYDRFDSGRTGNENTDKALKQSDDAENSTRSTKSSELDGMVTGAINRAVEVDETYRDRLKAVYDGTYQCDETSASESQGLPDLPQEGWSATEVSAWWNSLTEDEKEKIIAEHPEAIGNLDGIAMKDRDKANRARLTGGGPDKNDRYPENSELGIAQREMDDAWQSGDSDKQIRAGRKLDDLLKLKDLMSETDEHGDPLYRLLTLDTSGGNEKDVRAAVAVGDVDNADNVATLVPGINTTIRDSMDDLLGNATSLRNAAGNYNTAAVAWLGYDAPPGVWGGAGGYQNGSDSDYMTTERADHGASALNSFHEGIHSWHQSQGTDPHLTTVDHSYGSLTAGTAALSTKTGVVDDMVLYGSPGGRATDVHEYNVPEGHVYASANDDDYVTGKGTGLKNKALGKGLGPAEEAAGFGEKPHNMSGVRLISSNEGEHSDYWNNPEFVEDVSQIAAGEDQSVDRVDDRSESAAEQEEFGEYVEEQAKQSSFRDEGLG